jgi:arsenite methyltransferase
MKKFQGISNFLGLFCRYYGCGLVFPTVVEGVSVLDFGSGAGRDCFVLSKLVGQDGFVTGVDMTEEQVQADRDKYTKHGL